MLKIGFYEKEITPPLGCHIPGYFNIRRSEDVIDRLYARAMAVSSDDETAVIISVDAVGIGDGTGKCMVATLCNGTFGYVPTRDMFYDTIYESKPGANKLNREAGYIMAEKLLFMKK